MFRLQSGLATQQGTLAIRQQFFETALDGLQEITAESQNSWQADHSLLIAHLRIGNILWYSGKAAEADGQYEPSQRLAESRLKRDPGDLEERYVIEQRRLRNLGI